MASTLTLRPQPLADPAGGYPRHLIAKAAWLVGYRSPETRKAYGVSIDQWFAWCDEHHVDPMEAVRPHVELWKRSLEERGLKERTVASRLNATASFYRYAVDEEFIDRNPMTRVERPKIDRVSPRSWLTRPQLADLLAAGQAMGPHPYALLSILALNGLRIAEACSLDVGSLGWDGYYPILTFTRKGGGQGRAVLARPGEAAVLAAIGERTSGPLLLTTYETRMNREAAARIIDRAMIEVRGAHGRITPHSLRHSWATACIAAHVPQDQLQHDGGWSDMRMVTYYAHGQDAPVRAASHAVAAFVYGAT